MRALAVAIVSLAALETSSAQLQDKAADNSVRVTVAQNQDGTRTSYQYDNANHKAVATTSGMDGKVVSTIRYELDEQNRYKSGDVFDEKGQLRFKSQYKYDTNGRLESETQLTKEGAVRSKLVYSYNDMGKQTGYAVYDGNGKLLGRSNAGSPPSGTGKK